MFRIAINTVNKAETGTCHTDKISMKKGKVEWDPIDAMDPGTGHVKLPLTQTTTLYLVTLLNCI